MAPRPPAQKPSWVPSTWKVLLKLNEAGEQEGNKGGRSSLLSSVCPGLSVLPGSGEGLNKYLNMCRREGRKGGREERKDGLEERSSLAHFCLFPEPSPCLAHSRCSVYVCWMLLHGCSMGVSRAQGPRSEPPLFLWDWLSPGVPAFPVTVHHVPWQVAEQAQAAAHRPRQSGWAVGQSCGRGCGSPAQLPWLSAHQGPAWRSLHQMMPGPPPSASR